VQVCFVFEWVFESPLAVSHAGIIEILLHNNGYCIFCPFTVTLEVGMS
jgi:hypothetical protein